ncbi:hypothetical protein [Burkholderia vietnamiensis]|uniref:hypothetical protein n=1 Tax=Burkholderia vietnamiensis TaxID=60552 RepID=UPI001CF5DE22|nr:hypothetical protein [Burkholderia vietnamiensis]MCA8198506.1 hypothetical protein [Burkholderia vietnamiensis]
MAATGLNNDWPIPEQVMSNLTPAIALRAAINVLRDSAESRKMPNGELLTDAVVQLHFDAADTLEESLPDLRDHE